MQQWGAGGVSHASWGRSLLPWGVLDVVAEHSDAGLHRGFLINFPIIESC